MLNNNEWNDDLSSSKSEPEMLRYGVVVNADNAKVRDRMNTFAK